MQLTIEHIQEQMAGSELSPGQIADFRVYLAAIGSLKTRELTDILTIKPERWLIIRDGKNSDRATDKAWDATAMGIKEMQLRMDLKRVDRLMSALGSKLRIMEQEARNVV